MSTVRNRELKELRRHSDEALPVKSYGYTALPGRIPVHCHWHDEMEFFMLTEGAARIQCGNETFSVLPGRLLFFNSGELHSADADCEGRVSFRSVVFHPEILCGTGVVAAKFITPMVSGRLVPPVEMENDAADSFNRLFTVLEAKATGYELEAQALLFHLLFLLINASFPQESGSAMAIKPAMEYMAKNYGSAICESDLAAACSMSTGHFCRVFRRHTTKTPMDYLKGLRVAKAMELLLAGDRKIIDVAMETGFNSPSYFIGVFREATGTTPGKFRRENRPA